MSFYSQTCVQRPYETRHMFGFKTGSCLLWHDSSVEKLILSALLSFSNKQPPVYSNFHVTRMDGRLKQLLLLVVRKFIKTMSFIIVDISLDAKAAEVASMLSGSRQDADYDQTSEGSSVLVPSGIKRKAKSQSTEPLSLKAQDFQVL